VRYKNKKIAVLGAGDSGEAAAILLAEEGAMVTVLDSADESKLRPKIDKLCRLGITLVAGTAAENDSASYDLAVISPGIDPAVPLARNFARRNIDLLGELEISYGLCDCPVVAITGTNGKTTTTELVARMLNSCGVRTLASGNIGPAFAATVRKSAGLDVMTLEVSSFQLEQIRNFRPRVAVWLNLTPDHLDRYASMEEYRAAKLRIFENQTAEDFAVVNLRDDLPPLAAKRITFSAYAQGGDFEFHDGVIHHHGVPALRMIDANLRGLHNVENLMAALGVGFALGLTIEQMAPALCSYKALPHRCELVRELDGVAYVNDSKATNLDALEKALLSETRPVVLIAGGKDKGFEFDSITSLVAQKTRAVVLIGEMSDRIASCWRPKARCEKAPSLACAVEMARAVAQGGDVVLFSPGTSSFDMFKNYADRGNQFRAIVQALPTS
jgi:UDP-N-acetylmuramoylalanine--D-glutamate ligase